MRLFRQPHAPVPNLAKLFLPLVAAALVLALVAACGPSPEEMQANREEIEALLEEYARQLSQAYAFTDPSALEGVATPREMAAVENNLARLAQQGRAMAAHQKEMVIEDLNVFQPGQAYVRTYEVWDIQVKALGSDEVISRDPDQQSRVRYRLKRTDDGEWKVLGRERLERSSEELEGGGGGGE